MIKSSNDERASPLKHDASAAALKHEVGATPAGTEQLAPKDEPDDDSQSKARAMAASLRPKGAIGLRVSAIATAAITPATVASNDRLSMVEYEGVAMEAMKSVKDKRADEAKERKRLKDAERMASHEADEARDHKRPKKETRPIAPKAEKADGMCKRPAAADVGPMKRPASALALCKGARPVCPSPKQTGPVLYNGGKVYSSSSKNMFRCIRTANDYYTEKGCSWKHGRGEAWQMALDAIDEYRRSGC